MDIHIRLETPADRRAVEELTREAFWGFTSPVCDEHYLAHVLRGRDSFVPALDFVAEADGRLVGNIMYTKAEIVGGDGDAVDVLTFGPLSVHPDYWRKGIGSALMRHSIGEARRLGHRAIVFYGHPDYYPRFGFRNAAAFGVTSASGRNFDALMAMPLYDGALDGVSGVFREDEAFSVNAEDAEKFDVTFPRKEPAQMIPIGVLLERLPEPARAGFAERGVKWLAELNRFSGREMELWQGMDGAAMETLNRTLTEHGYSRKLPPRSYIFQLAEMGLRIPAASLLASKDGVHVYRVESEGEKYVLKVFDDTKDRREISNYALLNALGVPALPMIKHTETALLLPDVEACETHRLGVEEDLSDPAVARAAARWYRALHDRGRTADLDGLYDETDAITVQNMAYVAEKTATRDAPLWRELGGRFSELRAMIDALPRTLTYNDFYWTNLVVAKDKKSALMLDFNLLGKGYAYADVRNVVSSLAGEARRAFLDEYGEGGLSAAERRADAVLSPLVTLYFACRREEFPTWAAAELRELNSGKLLENLKNAF